MLCIMDALPFGQNCESCRVNSRRCTTSSTNSIACKDDFDTNAFSQKCVDMADSKRFLEMTRTGCMGRAGGILLKKWPVLPLPVRLRGMGPV